MFYNTLVNSAPEVIEVEEESEEDNCEPKNTLTWVHYI